MACQNCGRSDGPDGIEWRCDVCGAMNMPDGAVEYDGDRDSVDEMEDRIHQFDDRDGDYR